MKKGRPSKLTAQVEENIFKKLSTSNKSLKTICKEEGIDIVNVLRRVNTDEDFRNKYARAKEEQADYLAEEIIEIADDSSKDTLIDPLTGREIENKEWVNRSRLRVDARKWVAAKLKPKKYGEKVELSGEVGIKQITGMEIK